MAVLKKCHNLLYYMTVLSRQPELDFALFQKF